MTTHLFETDRATGVTVHTDTRTGVRRTLTGMPAERGDGRRGNLARQLRAMSATVTPAPAATRSTAPATTSTTSATVQRLARIGVR